MKNGTLQFWFLTTVFLILALPELLAGAIGLAVPLVAPLVFYVTLVYNWRVGLTAALVAAVFLDLGLGRSFPWSLAVFPVVAGVAWCFRRGGGSFPELPDMIVPALVSLGAGELVWSMLEWLEHPGLAGFWLAAGGLVVGALAGTVIAFFMTWILDAVARQLGLPQVLVRDRSALGRSRYTGAGGNS